MIYIVLFRNPISHHPLPLSLTISPSPEFVTCRNSYTTPEDITFHVAGKHQVGTASFGIRFLSFVSSFKLSFDYLFDTNPCLRRLLHVRCFVGGSRRRLGRRPEKPAVFLLCARIIAYVHPLGIPNLIRTLLTRNRNVTNVD
ncbi:hypothetical protein HanPSC8_Chr05g0191041 [Helianthus annuus]|nr:hypothetical protein HanPSC8_Chr05g0191041 [Helianthus annuus]